ncbi:hypothetical protein RV07_GL001301 [Enterococcus malodoratus]|nr:hypothetical protein RV07_GL001301 [Enterococcus malodoratus]
MIGGGQNILGVNKAIFPLKKEKTDYKNLKNLFVETNE